MQNVVRWARTIGWLACMAYGCATSAPVKQGVAPPRAAEPDASPVVHTRSAATPPTLEQAIVLDLASLRQEPARFTWFDFKPGVKKLILSGAADSRHVAVLWYFESTPGAVPLHYHEKTESIFVLDGGQSDAKGRYTKGTFYFNPPGSGHNVFDSAGLFLLAYAAPPDFKRVAEIGAYQNLVVGADYGQLELTPCSEDGVACHVLPLAANGGMAARFIQPSNSPVAIHANALVVLRGACNVQGAALAADTLVVTKSADPAAYQVARHTGDCLLFALTFQ